MHEETKNQTTSQLTTSLDSLKQRIAEREAKIDELRLGTAAAALGVFNEIIAQGQDLRDAQMTLGDSFTGWLELNYGKSIRTAQRYIAVAEKSKTVSMLTDAAFQRELFSAAGLVPKPEQVEAKVGGLAVPPIVQRLNFVAEWVTKEAGAVATWEQNRRDELRVRLKPVIDLYNSL